MDDFSFWIITKNLLLATRWTILLTVVAFIGGASLGLVLTFARVGRVALWRRLAMVWIETLQGTPLLMQLFLVFFGLPFVGLDLAPLSAAALVFTAYASAHLAEIWRGCVQAVPKGQWEASASLGFGYLQQMRHVILPQALRLAIPATTGFLVQLVKGTALASSIGLVEIVQAGNMMNNATFRPFLIYGLIALIYFALCYPLSRYSQHLERKLHGAR